MNQIFLGRYDIYVIILLTFVLRYFQIHSVDYPNGWDGCFYEMQLHCWLKYGTMHSPNFSSIYFLLKPIAWLTTPTYAYKTVAILATTLFSTLVTLYTKKITGRLESYAVWLFSLSSPLLLFISHQFTKNLLGLNLIILYFLIKKKWWLISSILLLAFFTHRLAFAVLAVIIIWDLIQALNRRQIIYSVFIGFSTITILSFIPGLPNYFDYLRVFKELKITNKWVPVAFYEVWSSEEFGIIWYIEVIFVHFILFIGGFFALKQRKLLPVLLVILLFITPIFGFSTGSLGYRLYLNAFCLLFLITPLVFKINYTKQLLIIVTYPLCILIKNKKSCSCY